MDKTLRVGFFHHYAVGDNVRILKPLFLLKYIYNAKVIVFGNALMCEMTKNLPFVDACINIGELEFSHIPLINAQNLDYAILSNARTKYVKILDSTNIKHFFTRLKLNSLFAKKSKTIFVKLPKYRHLNGVDIMCEYVKKINPKLAAKKLAQISTDEIDNSSKLITSYENKQNITKFFYLLGNNIMAKNGGGGVDSITLMQKSYIEFDIESLQTLNIEISNEFSNEKYFFIGVNPFSHSAWASFTLQNYLKIIANLCAIKNVIVIVVSYGEFHDRLINALSDFKDSSAFQRLAILKNNGDILNLAELISRLSLLISPSSGPIHIATNLLIPTIGIYSKEDTTKWATRDKRYVILSKDTNNITESENTAAMQSVIDITQNLITQNALIARSFNEEVLAI